MNFNDLCAAYFESYDFKACKEGTQSDYIYWASRLGSVAIGGKLFGFIHPHKISTPIAQQAYEYLLNSGVSMANHVVGLGSIVFGHSIRVGNVNHNPFTHIKRRTSPNRKVVWTSEDIDA
jgi:hypothetical protein